MAEPLVTEFPKEYLTALDEIVEQESFTTAYQETGAEFTSTKTVLIPELIIANGTVPYDKFETMNDTAIKYAAYELDQDRQTTFYIDAVEDIDEQHLRLLNLASEFNRTKLVPEIDTYFFGKVKANAKTDAKTNLTAANIKEELRNARMQMVQNGFNAAELYMSVDALSCLEDAIDRQFAGEGTITDVVGHYDMFNVHMVPDDRLGLDFAVIAGGKKTIKHIWKRQVSNYFGPGTWQRGDGTALQMRWVYGTLCPKNRKGGIYVSKGTAKPDTSVKPVRQTVVVQQVAAGSGAGNGEG